MGLRAKPRRRGVEVETVATHPVRIGERRRHARRRVAAGRAGIIATASPPATDAALSILRSGGNAVDAAVAAAWALAVCEPSGSGLGGHTTVLIRFADGRCILLDGHSFAPGAVSPDTVDAGQQKRGYRACTVPSTPAILGAALERFGRLAPRSVLEPAIGLADAGFAVTPLLRRQVRWCREALARCEYSAAVFLDHGEPPEAGRSIRQPVLSRTLQRLVARGTQDFYVGGIARRIVQDMERNDGLLTAADLADYRVPEGRDVLRSSYRGYTVLTAPPPAGGLLLAQALRILERLSPVETLVGSAGWYLTIAGIVRAVFRDRARRPVPPHSWTPELGELLTGDDCVERLCRTALREPAAAAFDDADGPGETTHLCVADGEGTVVSLTQSIQSLFGAKVANRELGFFYNNYLWACPRRRHPYGLASRAMPRSNVAPTIAVLDGAREDAGRPTVLALGAAGSRRITSALLQVIGNRIERRMALSESIDGPRVHPMLNGKLLVEKRIAAASLLSRLGEEFGQTVARASRSYSMGAVQAIERHDDGCWIGAADPRRDGTAGGY